MLAGWLYARHHRIYPGFLASLRTEDELEIVLGSEMLHKLARHDVENLRVCKIIYGILLRIRQVLEIRFIASIHFIQCTFMYACLLWYICSASRV